MERITLATKEVEDDDGNTEEKATEWIEVNQQVINEVSSRAMSDNVPFGDALAEYLSDRLTDDE